MECHKSPSRVARPMPIDGPLGVADGEMIHVSILHSNHSIISGAGVPHGWETTFLLFDGDRGAIMYVLFSKLR